MTTLFFAVGPVSFQLAWSKSNPYVMRIVRNNSPTHTHTPPSSPIHISAPKALQIFTSIPPPPHTHTITICHIMMLYFAARLVIMIQMFCCVYLFVYLNFTVMYQNSLRQLADCPVNETAAVKQCFNPLI